MKSAECRRCQYPIFVSLSARLPPELRVAKHVITGIFDDDFIDYLYDLVEQTRTMQDESFNYSVIKLLVSPAQLAA